MCDLTEPEPIAPVESFDGGAWLAVDRGDHDGPIWVNVVGGIFDDRADELWSTLEGVLQEATGRMVVVNLAGLTGFDALAVEALVAIARAVKRWHVDLCVVVQPTSAMDGYLQLSSVDRLISVYGSVQAAADAADAAESAWAGQRAG